MSSIKKHIPYDHCVICDVCGKKRKKSETIMAYGSGDLAVVLSCKDGCADDRHPLNSPPPVIYDAQPVDDARPDLSSNKSFFIPQQVFPSFMTWNHLQGAPTWGHFNNNNNPFSLVPLWYWGSFSRP